MKNYTNISLKFRKSYIMFALIFSLSASAQDIPWPPGLPIFYQGNALPCRSSGGTWGPCGKVVSTKLYTPLEGSTFTVASPAVYSAVAIPTISGQTGDFPSVVDHVSFVVYPTDPTAQQGVDWYGCYAAYMVYSCQIYMRKPGTYYVFAQTFPLSVSVPVTSGAATIIVQ